MERSNRNVCKLGIPYYHTLGRAYLCTSYTLVFCNIMEILQHVNNMHIILRENLEVKYHIIFLENLFLFFTG